MKEKLEHKLTKRINDVFDSHEPDFNPQDWEKMKEKLPQRKAFLTPLFYNILKAVAVLVLIGVGSNYLWNLRYDQEPVVKQQTEFTEDNNPQEWVKEDFFISSPESVSNQNIFDNSPIQPIEELTQQHKSGKIKKIIKHPADQKALYYTNIQQAPETIQFLPSDLFADLDPDMEIRFRPDELYLMNVNDAGESNEIVENFDEDSDLSPIASQRSTTSLGVEVASFTQYAPDDLNPGLGFGAGFAANIPVFKGLAFAPGLTVNRQNLAFENQNSFEYAGSFSATNSSDLKEYLEENSDISPTQVNLTALDIPLNLQYRFIKRTKTNYFIELGVSSLFYLSESYTYEFPNDVSGGYDVEAFNTFDFAKLLNLSIGMGYRLSKRFDMIFNPYLKYPIGDLSDAELRFGNGGLKLKFMIIPKN